MTTSRRQPSRADRVRASGAAVAAPRLDAPPSSGTHIPAENAKETRVVARLRLARLRWRAHHRRSVAGLPGVAGEAAHRAARDDERAARARARRARGVDTAHRRGEPSR